LGRTGGWHRWGGRTLVALSAAVTGLFFASFWAIDAEPLGRHDLGIALAGAFAVPLTFYASLGLALLAAALGAAAWLRRAPVGTYAWALLLALLPVGFLALLDARLLPIRFGGVSEDPPDSPPRSVAAAKPLPGVLPPYGIPVPLLGHTVIR
jgi:hypothetical protein